MKFEYLLDNTPQVVEENNIEEFITKNPQAKFIKEIDEPGNTDPSPEKKDAPVEDKDMASRLDSGSLVYQESNIGELVNKIQNAEKEGEAILFPPGMGELDKIALEEVVIGVEKPQEKSIKDQQTLAQRMAVYQPPITPGEEIKEDILKGIVEYDPRTDEEKEQEAFIAEEKRKQGEILQAPGVIEAAERKAEALYPTNFKKKPDSFSESILNSFGNNVLDLEGMSPRLKGLIGVFAKRGLEGMGYDTSDESLEGKWYNKYIAEGKLATAKEKSRSKLAQSFTDADSLKDFGAATIDGVMSFATSIAKLRLGVGFVTKTAKGVEKVKRYGLLWPDIFARQIQNYNIKKAESKGITLEKLYNNNEAEIITPGVAAAFTYYLEKKSIDNFTNYMSDMPNTMAKQLLSTASLFTRNGLQEYLQFTNEEFNLYLAELKGQGYKLDGAGVTKGIGELLGKKFLEIATSDAAIDAGLKGSFGSVAITSPSTVKNIHKIRTQSDKDRRAEQVAKKNILLETASNLDLAFEIRQDASKRAHRIELEMYNDVINKQVIYDNLMQEQKDNIDKAFEAKKLAESKRAKVLNNKELNETEKNILIKDYDNEIIKQFNIIENILELSKEQEKASSIVETENLNKSKPITITPFATAAAFEKEGFEESGVEAIDPDTNTININLERAANMNNVTPFRHGILHGVLTGTFTKAQLEDAVKILKSELDEDSLADIERRLEKYDEDQKTPDEFITQYYEVAKENGAFENQSFLNKIGNLYRDILRSVGYTNIKFDNSESIKNFLLDYDRAFGKGKLLTGTKVDFDEKAYSKSILELYNKYNNNTEDMVIETFSGETDVLNTEFGQSIGGLVESIAKRLFDKTLPDVTKVIDENRGEARKQFKRQVIEDAAIMVLNEFDESKQSIDRFISNRLNLRANAVLKNMGVMPSVEKGGLGIGVEVTESVIKDTDEQIKLPQEETKTSKPFAEKLELDNDFKNKIVKAVENTFGTKLPNVSEKKFRIEFEKKNRAELTPIIQKQLADKDDFKKFLIKNYETILGKLPQRIVNKKYKNFGAAITDETGKQIRAKTKVGEAQFKKVKPTKQEFVDYFTSEKLGSSTRSDRKQSLLRTIVDELSFDAALDAINNPDVVTKLELQGIEVNKLWVEELKKAIERDQLSIYDLKNRNKEAGIKYSKVIEEAENQELNNKQIDDFLSIYLKDKNKAYDKNPDLYVAVEEDYGKKQGVGAEQKQGDIIKLANKNNKGFSMASTAAGNDNTVIDYQVKINGKAEGVENKDGSNNYGQLARILGNTENLKTNNGNILIEDVLKRKEAQSFIEALDKIAEVGSKILGIKKENFDFTQENTAFMIDKGHTDQWESQIFISKGKGLQAEVEKNGKFSVPQEVVKNYYKTKDANFPGTGLIDKGLLYSFNGITLGINAPILELAPEISLRVRVERIMKMIDGEKTKIGFYPKIVAEYRANNITKEKGIDISNLEKAEKAFSNIKYSKIEDLEKEMNSMIERKKGIEVEKTFSEPQARRLGRKAERIKLYVPYTAEDLLGLTYRFAGKGEQGDKDLKFFKENLFDPLTEANMQFEAMQQDSEKALEAAKKIIKNQKVDLSQEAIDGYTNDHVIRIFMWNRRGYSVPELSKEDQAKIVKYARQNFDIVTIADAIESAYPDFQYGQPDNTWVAGTITTDLLDFTSTITRNEIYQKFFDNVEAMFGKFNKGNGRLTGPIANKIRAAYGNTFIKALESSLYRIYTGRNRAYQLDKQGNIILDWMNNTIGNIMFINSRSAILQTISNINFTNWSDNNPLKIAERWADVKQFSKDFVYIFNSDYLKSRRGGLKTDVQEQEIAEAAKNSKNRVRAMIAVILKKGFLPTQYADSFAIAIGGASFYRNRANTYIKQGFEKAEAEQKAFADMREISETTQQSGRPEKISQEQAGFGGRLILAFQNTPMQYNRIMKRAIQDLYNGRGIARENISKIIYYGIAQNALFYAMQQALFSVIFDEPETTEEEKKEKQRYYNLINGMADSILRGSGIFGAIVSTGKNTILKVLDREGFDEKAIEEIANLSPPLGKKTRQLFDIRDKFQFKQNKEKIKELGLDTRNPAILAAGDALSFGINLPADRALRKINNLRTAMEKETEMWQRIALSLGWSEWELNIDRDKTNSLSPKIKGLKKKTIKKKTIKKK